MVVSGLARGPGALGVIFVPALSGVTLDMENCATPGMEISMNSVNIQSKDIRFMIEPKELVLGKDI